MTPQRSPLASLTAALAVLATLPALASAQDYTQYEVQYMTVKSDAISDLNEAMAEHNQEYHSGGPYHANVWYVVNGPRTGQLIWIMGPTTFTELDGRPAGQHDVDWAENVVPHLEPEGDVSYWRMAENLSYSADEDSHPLLRVRYFKIAPGEGFRFRELRRQIKEVQEAKGYPHSESVFFPRFRPETGGDAAAVMAFDQWADLDSGPNFGADFREVHGNGAWQRFLTVSREIIEDSWDQYQSLMPELSGNPGM